jgi:hypothetical protein
MRYPPWLQQTPRRADRWRTGCTMLGAPALIRTRTCASGRPSRVSWINEPCGLTTENSLAKGAAEEGVLHIELLNRPIARDNNSEHCSNSGRFHNRAESLVVVDHEALSETPEDLASLVAIKGPIDTKLVREDPLAGDDVGATGPGDNLPGPIAHQGPVLVLHSQSSIGVSKRSTYRGRDRGWCRWRRRGSEDQAIRKHPETHLGPSDHLVRIHQKSHRYSRRRSSKQGPWAKMARIAEVAWCRRSERTATPEVMDHP